uniref:RNA/RNP complex-1-interacting phosphatase n=1 Tax=Panagrolaimus sp. ES5 TaxID=591445 RepID=A0AC34FA32_9BILA
MDNNYEHHGNRRNENNGNRRRGGGEGYHLKKDRQPKGQQQHRPSSKFPDRWEKYLPLGQLMPETRFIAFKTPLSNHFFEGKDDVPFMIPDIVKEVEKSGKKLGLVFDLTATTRYYESSEWAKYGVRYEKIFCQGHNVHQQANVVEKFINIVDKFFDYHKDENYIVGVHCTHGINRTGFLICRYLMQRKGWDAAKAIASFETSRGIKIERSEYITALQNFKASGSKSGRSSTDSYKSRRNSTDGNDTTWRNSSTSWRNSDSSSSWRPSSSSSHHNGSRNYSITKSYRPSESWKPNFNSVSSRDNSSHSSSLQQRDTVEANKCQEATMKLRGLLNIGESFLPPKK